MDIREPDGAGAYASGAPAGSDPTQGAAAVKDEVKSLLSEAKQETARLAGTARDKVADSATTRKDAAAEKVGTVADVLREAGQRLQQEEAGFGRYAESAADQVERLAQYLRRKDLGGMVRDAETFARRHPELFLGVAFIGGIAAARFLKSTAPRPELTSESSSAALQPMPGYSSGYGPGYATGYGYGSGSQPAQPSGQPTQPFNPPHLVDPTPGTGGGDL